MARPKKQESEEQVEETVETTEETQVEETEQVEETPKSKKTTVSVQFYGGVREYSKEVHGADFEKLATEFAKKFNGTIV